MHRSLAYGVLAAVSVTPLTAQEWVELFPTNTPPGLTGHAMAFDVNNDRTVLFGGGLGGSLRSDETWLFDGTDWSQSSPATSPGARAGHPLAYDLARGRVVLFGGIGVGTGSLSDTWEWDGTTWTQMNPATVPPARLSHPLVYHPGRGTCVMAGGNGLPGTLSDTWEWDGVDWTQIVTASFPSPLRFAGDMAYEPSGNGLVFFGGYIGGVGQSDTWYFDNVDWVQRTPTTVPPGRFDHTMTTDAVSGRVIMYGETATADTWEYDGNDWSMSPSATLPDARYDDYLVYDLVRGQTLMYGGDFRNDTWVYQTPPQPGFATAIPYGEGCVNETSASIYELFPANGFDLSNTTLQFLPTIAGYAVLQGAPQWFTPLSGNLGIGDEQVSAPQPLGFTLNYPGGSTTDVFVSSNGFVFGQPGGAPECCNGSLTQFLNGLPRWAPAWFDLNPAAGGTVHFDVDPVAGAAYVTFDQVPEYNQSATVTFQVAFFDTGVVEYRFQNCANLNHTALTGWTPGGGVGDPGMVDLSAITTPVITSPDKMALWHRSDLRPVLGNTVALTTGPIPASAILSATVFGFTEINPGLDLTSFGMPGCFQYVSLDVPQLALPAGGLATVQFTVPTSTSYVGVQIKTQGAAFVPGYNAAGAVVSNGLKLIIDAG